MIAKKNKKFFTIKIRENKIKIIFFVIKKYFITKEMFFVEQKRKKRKNKKNYGYVIRLDY